MVDHIHHDPILRWAALLHDLGKPSCFFLDEAGIGHFYGHAAHSTMLTENILTRLRFDNSSKSQIEALVRYHDMPITSDRKLVKRLLSKHGVETTRQLIELHKADTLGQSAKCQHRLETFASVSSLVDELLREESCFSLKNLAVNGRDMISLGFSGKQVGLVLQACLDAVLDEHIPNERIALMLFAQSKL